MRSYNMDPRGREPGKAIQYFTYGPFEFNINRAAMVAGNRKKYRPETTRPLPEWLGPFIEIDESHIKHADSHKPVLFATFIREGHPRILLIDGNHRVAQALRQQKNIKTIVLDLEDTLKIVSGPKDLLEQIRNDGMRLGLLQADPKTNPTPSA